MCVSLSQLGFQVYFGPVGAKGNEIVKYFHGVSPLRCPPLANPATWMLEVLGDRDDVENKKDECHLSTVYFASSLAQANEKALSLFHTETDPLTSYLGVSLLVQYIHVQGRFFTSYWRNGPFMRGRVVVITITGVFFGLVFYQIPVHDLGGVQSILSAGMRVRVGVRE